MYIRKEDLYSKIRQSDLAQIVPTGATVIDHAIAMAEGKATAILSAKFNVAEIFGAEEPEPILVTAIVDIAIYEIVALAQPNIDLTDRRERAQEAVQYLKDIASGTYPVWWPLKDVSGGETSVVISGGTPSRNNYF